MPAQVQRRFGRSWKRILRWGIAGLLLLALAMGAATCYLRTVGVPEFVKSRFAAGLRGRGISLQMDHVRLRGFGLVAENVRLQPVHSNGRPQVFMERVDLRFSGAAVRKGRIQPETLLLENGKATWLIASSNAAPQQVSLDDLGAALRFLPNDRWELARLDGRLRNGEIHITASMTNATAIRDWSFGEKGKPKADWQTRANEILTQVQALDLSSGSKLTVRLAGDARDPGSLQANLRLETSKAVWRGRTLEDADLEAAIFPMAGQPGISDVRLHVSIDRGTANQLHFQNARLTSRSSGSIVDRSIRKADWQLALDQIWTQSAAGQTLAISATTRPSANDPEVFETELSADVEDLQSPFGRAMGSHLTASIRHEWSSVAPWEARWRLASTSVSSSRGEVSGLRLSGRLSPRAPFARWQPVEASWGFWAALEPFEFEWDGAIQRLSSPHLEVDNLAVSGRWLAPELIVEQASADLYGGKVHSAAWMNVASRELRSEALLDFDVRRVSPLLTPVSRKWLGQFGWQIPPTASATIRLQLPPWTNAQPNWRDEVMPTIELAGYFEGTGGSFRGVPVTFAQSHFALTNMVWHLPDLFVKRPDGEAKLAYVGHMGTHDFRWTVDASMPPNVLKPVLEGKAVTRTLDLLRFTVPPSVRGDVWGRWNEPESVQFIGQIAATNFTFRSELCKHLTGALRFTNSLLSFSNVWIKGSTGQITVPAGNFDLAKRVVNVTNAISTMDPDLVTRVIGPKVRAAVRPYQFQLPPTVRVNGRLPTVRIKDADVRFEVTGEAFSYWKLNVPAVSGDVRWRGDSLTITNVKASFYGGELAWKGDFDFSVPVGARFAFQGIAKNADLHALMDDLGKRTNDLHGTLDGRLVVTSALSQDWHSWQGFGTVRMRNGFLWDIPIFGFFSPVLNAVVPGLGNSPISAGDATFTIRQSVVHSDDLELKSPALRLDYAGTADFNGNLKARMQAEILRDAWGVGRVLSLALWPLSKAFEYRLTGTVSHPKTDPVYIPKFLLWPLHPIQSLQRLLLPRKWEPPPIPAPGLFEAPTTNESQPQ